MKATPRGSCSEFPGSRELVIANPRTLNSKPPPTCGSESEQRIAGQSNPRLGSPGVLDTPKRRRHELDQEDEERDSGDREDEPGPAQPDKEARRRGAHGDGHERVFVPPTPTTPRPSSSPRTGASGASSTGTPFHKADGRARAARSPAAGPRARARRSTGSTYDRPEPSTSAATANPAAWTRPLWPFPARAAAWAGMARLVPGPPGTPGRTCSPTGYATVPCCPRRHVDPEMGDVPPFLRSYYNIPPESTDTTHSGHFRSRRMWGLDPLIASPSAPTGPRSTPRGPPPPPESGRQLPGAWERIPGPRPGPQGENRRRTRGRTIRSSARIRA